MSFARRALSWIALMVFVGGLITPLASPNHLRWDDDLDCGSGVLALGHLNAGIGVDEHLPAAARAHCTICHLQRALTGSVMAPLSVTPFWAEAELQPQVLVRWHRQQIAAAQPSRAPPSSSYS
jgi:hypothetical protein